MIVRSQMVVYTVLSRVPTITRAFTLSYHSKPYRPTLVPSKAFDPLETTSAHTTTSSPIRSMPMPVPMAARAEDDTGYSRRSLPSCYGGDYAGHVATFSATDGKPIPIPEYYVPSTLIEWGQIPSSFELLTSEDFGGDFGGDGDGNGNVDGLDRVGIRVVPDVGCGIDNLDTLVKKDSIPLSSFCGATAPPASTSTTADGSCSSSLCYPNPNSKDGSHTLETVFLLPPSSSSSDLLNDYHGRVRIELTLRPNSTTLPSSRTPIQIVVERRTSNVSTKGSVIEGGGLTGSAVFTLVGKENVNKPFSDGDGVVLDRLVGRWKTVVVGEGTGGVVERDVDGYWDKDGVRTLSLPGNVVVRFEEREEGRVDFPWVVEVSRVCEDEDGGETRRSVVERTFWEDGTSTVRFWDEIKEV